MWWLASCGYKMCAVGAEMKGTTEMAKNFIITITCPADDQADMFDGDYTMEDFQQIVQEAVNQNGWTKLGASQIKVTSITVKEDN